MVLPIPNLDDRRFDDLVKEGRERVAKHLPELTTVAPGDPAHAMVDLFAYLTESMLYRMNLIPERQRRAVMNLLQIPVRNAQPSKGVVCIDASATPITLPSLIRDGAQLKAGAQTFTGAGELQPTQLSVSVSIKRALENEELNALGVSLQELRDQYGIKAQDKPEPFEPQTFIPGKESLSLATSLDKYFYLAFLVPKKNINVREDIVDRLLGIILNVAIAPDDDINAEGQAQEISSLAPRKLLWEFVTRDEESNVLALPLEIVADSSRGGRQMGVVRLRLPDNPDLFDNMLTDDPMFAGVGQEPPELPAQFDGEQVAFWLRLSSEDEPDLNLGYLGVNGLDILGQGVKSDITIGVGTGQPDQTIKLPDNNIAPESIILQVEEDNAWVSWQKVDFLVGLDSDAKAYRLDSTTGVVYFGDGLEGGKRPPEGRRIRVASYLYGGGSATNVNAGDIKEITTNATRLTVRHEWPTKGGLDAETVTQAERRIPQYLTHRNRAVTAQDFRILAENNPVNPVAKAQVIEGFLPGNTIHAVRENVPGVVSVFVLPPRAPALRQTPKPSKGLLKDVFEYLLQRILIGTELYVLSPEFKPMAVGVKVEVVNLENEQDTLQAVQTSMVNYLWSLAPGGAIGDGWPMGVNVRASELATQVARVPGVKAVNNLSIFVQSEDLASRNQLAQVNEMRRRSKRWKRLAENEAMVLNNYQLPELLGVSASTGSGEPRFPNGIDALLDGENSGAGNGIPAPIIPDVC